MGLFRTQKGPAGHEDSQRLKGLGVFFSVLIVVILLRTFAYQVWDRDTWSAVAPSQYQNRVKLIAQRGIVYDRDMNILAMDLPQFSLGADPTQIKDFEKAALRLSEIFSEKKEFYLDLLKDNQEKSFIWIKKDISDAQKNALFEEKVYGLIPVQERKRVHPYSRLASQILGITNMDHEGVGGVEQTFNAVLRGDDGWTIFQKDGYNRNFSSLDYPIEKPKDGDHLVLTINHAFQTIVEEELQRGAIQYKAKKGSAVLMDPYSGEILAMASQTSYKQIPFGEQYQNQAVQVDFEPGSTFKIVVAAAALEEEVCQLNSLVHCENGAYRLANHTINDHDKAYSWLTLGQVLEVSSNIGIAKIGKKLGKDVLYKYCQNFGFGSRISIGLPGETGGILHPLFQWNDFMTATISFGQGISVTSLQMANMVSAIANGGELVKPWIVKKVLDQNGGEKKVYSKQVLRRVVSEETAHQVRLILENVVEKGSGTEAQVEGVRVAGKTGTAEKSLPGYKGYYPGRYVSSFVGFWPADTPMFVLVIVYDEPKVQYWGAKSAAPVFARIVERISGIPHTPRPPNSRPKSSRIKDILFSSYKEPVERIQMVSYLEKPNSKDTPYHVPSLVGLSVREALRKLAARDIEGRVFGSGIVIQQKPEAGRKIVKNAVCQMICQDYITESELQ